MKIYADKIIELKKNSMLVKRPELILEWDFEKNNELGLNVYKTTFGTARKVYWICSKCSTSYTLPINKRTIRKQDCTSCSNRVINSSNSLVKTHPILASEWHPTKNGTLTPHDVGCGKKMKVWWLGECEHEWEAVITDRSNGAGCHYCTNQKVLIGFNDMWTTKPELAKLLLNPDDGYKYMRGSTKKVDWQCPHCNNPVFNKRIEKARVNNVYCSICSKDMSYPEKVMMYLLKTSNVFFIKEYSTKWSDKKRYDFYLPIYNTIIETHGGQHYCESFVNMKEARSLKEEQENDRYKEQLAKDNGIENYIVIDCRKSEFDFIKENIKNSPLFNTLNLEQTEVDWEIIKIESSTPIGIRCLELWNSGVKNISTIAKECGIVDTTVRRYLYNLLDIN